jgi:hypothetical protein
MLNGIMLSVIKMHVAMKSVIMLIVMAPLFYQLLYCRWPEMSKEFMLKLTLNQVIASINHHVSLGLLQMILASLVPML